MIQQDFKNKTLICIAHRRSYHFANNFHGRRNRTANDRAHHLFSPLVNTIVVRVSFIPIWTSSILTVSRSIDPTLFLFSLSSLSQFYDRILVMDAGKVAEVSTHLPFFLLLFPWALDPPYLAPTN